MILAVITLQGVSAPAYIELGGHVILPQDKTLTLRLAR
jgi:hypothetical protein